MRASLLGNLQEMTHIWNQAPGKQPAPVSAPASLLLTEHSASPSSVASGSSHTALSTGDIHGSHQRTYSDASIAVKPSPETGAVPLSVSPSMDDDTKSASTLPPDPVGFDEIDLAQLRNRGKGIYRCSYGKNCTKGGVDRNGNIVIFERNCMFRSVMSLSVICVEHGPTDSFADNTWTNIKSHLNVIFPVAKTRMDLPGRISLSGTRGTSNTKWCPERSSRNTD